jgi:hypothetical protein
LPRHGAPTRSVTPGRPGVLTGRLRRASEVRRVDGRPDLRRENQAGLTPGRPDLESRSFWRTSWVRRTSHTGAGRFTVRACFVFVSLVVVFRTTGRPWRGRL